MLKKKSCLILGRGLPDPLPCNSPEITGDNALFIDELVKTKTLGRLPKDPPNEIHPYKQDFPLQNFEKYIIGTFPPISYILDKPQLNDDAIFNLQQPNGAGGDAINLPWIPFYHGNQRKGSMWDFLLKKSEMEELTAKRNGDKDRQEAKKYLIDFLLMNEINYADIIDSTQRKLNAQGRYDAKDKNLNNICPNDNLICHILSNQKAKYLLFNTSSIFSNSGISFGAGGLVNVDTNTKSFDLFVRQCQELGLEIQISIPYGKPAIQYTWTNLSELTKLQRKTKLTFEMKIKNPLDNQKLSCDFKQGSERNFTIVTPFSPAALNYGSIKKNLIVKNWLFKNTGQNQNNLLTLVYQYFRNNTLLPHLYEMNGLYEMNV